MSVLPRVAVIGAGCSGITALKNCLAKGLPTVCFELMRDVAKANIKTRLLTAN